MEPSIWINSFQQSFFTFETFTRFANENFESVYTSPGGDKTHQEIFEILGTFSIIFHQKL